MHISITTRYLMILAFLTESRAGEAAPCQEFRTEEERVNKHQVHWPWLTIYSTTNAHIMV